MLLGGAILSGSGGGQTCRQLRRLAAQATENPHYKISVGVL